MIWKGHELKTYGDIMRLGLDKCESPREAREFMKAYFKETPHAFSNVGYLAGYYNRADAERIWDWFQCAHPIFGTAQLSPEEILEAGMKLCTERGTKDASP